MKSNHGAALACAVVAIAAGASPLRAAEHLAEHATEHSDPVTGVALALDAGWQVMADPVLFEDTYGFAVYTPSDGEHEREAIARVALVRGDRPRLDDAVANKAALYEELAPRRSEVRVGGRHEGVLLSGLPGTRHYTVVFTRVGARVYEIGLWTDEPALDARARSLLARLRFFAPTRTVASLGLEEADDALYAQPPPARALENAGAALARYEVVRAALAREGSDGATEDDARAAPLAATCGFTAPRSLPWQLQWDRSNTFYSGSHYSLQSRPGFSAMSGNYGSWWGTNYHVGLCFTTRANQYFANDWPAQHWANAYAAFSGTVEWAGWGTDGFYTLGRYVVVRRGAYRNVTAHLSGVARGVRWGASINGYWDVIGWAGSTGGPWAPHLHARVSWGERLTANGQPYGGQSVRPRRLRCFDCGDPDVITAAGARYYNSFWHGRWMRY